MHNKSKNIKYILIICLCLLILFLYKKNKYIYNSNENFADCLYNNFPDQQEIQNILNIFLNNINPYFPVGGIIIWYGSLNSIPYGWALCDGKNNTPNLSGRFILGYDSVNYPTLRAVGGEATHTLTVAEMPSHFHHLQDYTSISFALSQRVFDSGAEISLDCNTGGDGRYPCNRVDIKELRTGGASAQSKPHENMPPYTVLAFIMKLPS
jgi:microcystin-dependent protein